MVDRGRKKKRELLLLLLFKVDFEKDFELVDSNYLDAVIRKMNFPVFGIRCLSASKKVIWGKSRNLSLCGLLVLRKFVMFSLLIYFISFFKALACTISSFESIFKCFF